MSVLDATASAVLVALHSAHHGTGRPKTLTDVEHAVARLDRSTWERARSLADALGASEPFAAGLRLTRAGDLLADSLGLERPASVAMWLKTNPRTYGAWALHQVAQNETTTGRLLALGTIVLPSPLVMRTVLSAGSARPPGADAGLSAAAGAFGGPRRPRAPRPRPGPPGLAARSLTFDGLFSAFRVLHQGVPSRWSMSEDRAAERDLRS